LGDGVVLAQRPVDPESVSGDMRSEGTVGAVDIDVWTSMLDDRQLNLRSDHVAAVNALDADAIMATFADDAYVNDARRDFVGAEAVRAWASETAKSSASSSSSTSRPC
jgi:hypothetical protein